MTNTTPTPAKPLSLPVRILVDRLATVGASARDERNNQKSIEGQVTYYKTEAEKFEAQAAELTEALKKLGHKA